MDSFKPLRGLVLLKRDTPESESGGIIIPENCQSYGWCAEVLEIGDGVENVKPGDRVMFQKEYCVLPFTDRTLGISDADKLLARLVVQGNIERVRPLNSLALVTPDKDNQLSDGITAAGTYKEVISGNVKITGLDCREVAYGFQVWYPQKKRFVCVENDIQLDLVNESEILCCEILE